MSFFISALLTDSRVFNLESDINKYKFKDKTFGEPSNTYTTGDFNFNKNFSGENDRLYRASSAPLNQLQQVLKLLN